MSRSVRVLLRVSAAMAVAAMASACGSERIAVAQSSPLYAGAHLFAQRCSGCHSLGVAAAYGSASNVRSAQANNGPNFNKRCERPVTRVLYAIENGGFSGAYMPQNIVVGRDAIDVAKFVSTYAGRAAPRLTGITRCQQQSVGTLPAAVSTPLASANPPAAAVSSTTAAASGPAPQTPAKPKKK